MSSRPWLAIALLGGCAELTRGPTTPIDAAPVSPAAEAGPGESGAGEGGAPDGGYSFATQVEPLLLDDCRHCHQGGGQAESSALVLTGTAATDYVMVVKLVNKAEPLSSRLLSKAAGVGHDGGTLYAPGSSQYTTLLNWIQQGAGP